MKKIAVYILYILNPWFLFAADKKAEPPLKQDSVRHVVYVRSYIHHISDIDIREQEYKIEIWLYLTSKDSIWGWDSLDKQFEVAGAKEIDVSFIPQYALKKDSVYRKLLKIRCTMSQDWDVDNYPFDKQHLDITVYTLRPLKWFLLCPTDCKIRYADETTDLTNAIENGWFLQRNALSVNKIIQKDIFDLNKEYSGIHFCIPLLREKTTALFLKLFIGMYVSFFVAFLAFFIKVKHVEPKFGLPVGGLFAAIGNKYVMENILPQSSEFTIVDTLHTSTIIAILFIILFSAISLMLHDQSSRTTGKFKISSEPKLNAMKWIDKNGSILILISYLILNISSVLWAFLHEWI